MHVSVLNKPSILRNLNFNDFNVRHARDKSTPEGLVIVEVQFSKNETLRCRSRQDESIKEGAPRLGWRKQVQPQIFTSTLPAAHRRACNLPIYQVIYLTW